MKEIETLEASSNKGVDIVLFSFEGPPEPALKNDSIVHASFISLINMEQQSLQSQLPQLFRNITDRLGKTRQDILKHFTQRGCQIEYQLSELIIRGYSFQSDATINIRFDECLQTYEIKENVCIFSYMFADSDEILKAYIQYCHDNYVLLMNDTWLITYPESKDVFYTLFLFTEKGEDGSEEKYFKCKAKLVTPET